MERKNADLNAFIIDTFINQEACHLQELSALTFLEMAIFTGTTYP